MEAEEETVAAESEDAVEEAAATVEPLGQMSDGGIDTAAKRKASWAAASSSALDIAGGATTEEGVGGCEAAPQPTREEPCGGTLLPQPVEPRPTGLYYGDDRWRSDEAA